jgi:hypothetical protein
MPTFNGCIATFLSFQVFVHSPDEFPLLTKRTSLPEIEIPPWQDVEVRIKPIVTTTDYSLKQYSPEIRGCRYTDDQEMRIFKVFRVTHIFCIIIFEM